MEGNTPANDTQVSAAAAITDQGPSRPRGDTWSRPCRSEITQLLTHLGPRRLPRYRGADHLERRAHGPSANESRSRRSRVAALLAAILLRELGDRAGSLHGRRRARPGVSGVPYRRRGRMGARARARRAYTLWPANRSCPRQARPARFYSWALLFSTSVISRLNSGLNSLSSSGIAWIRPVSSRRKRTSISFAQGAQISRAMAIPANRGGARSRS